MSESRTYEDWISVFETGTDYEADLVRDRLDDAGLTAVVLTQRDHAFNLNVGDLAAVHVMVPPRDVDDARDVLESEPFSDEELNEAAMSADPDAPPAHSDREEAILDSSPNIGGSDEGPIEEPGVSQEEKQAREHPEGEADPEAKRRHRDERRARHTRKNRPADEQRVEEELADEYSGKASEEGGERSAEGASGDKPGETDGDERG